MPWNFAFGSHLSSKQFSKIVGPPQDSRRATLYDYALTFWQATRFPAYAIALASGGSPVLTPEKGATTHGVAYAISEKQLKILDEYEAEWDYERVTLSVEIEGKGLVSAAAHNRRSRARFARPSQDFLDLMVEGLKEHGYADSVIRDVRSAARGAKN
jgi:gamma-glutamylcyclotransferase (GGCT)/AIG2-like uncharacterized protein YtfP